jgi:hypothetical protein
MNVNNQSDVFINYDPNLFQHLINQLRKQSFKSISSFKLSSNEEKTTFKTMLIDFSIFVVPTTSKFHKTFILEFYSHIYNCSQPNSILEINNESIL